MHFCSASRLGRTFYLREIKNRKEEIGMKNRIRRIIAVLLAVVMVLCAVPAAGFTGLDLSGVADWFSTTARAATILHWSSRRQMPSALQATL